MIKGGVLMFVLVCMINILYWTNVVVAIQYNEMNTLMNLKKMNQLQRMHYEMIQEVKYFLSLNEEEYQGQYQISVDNDHIFIKNNDISMELEVEIVENEVFDYSSH